MSPDHDQHDCELQDHYLVESFDGATVCEVCGFVPATAAEVAALAAEYATCVDAYHEKIERLNERYQRDLAEARSDFETRQAHVTARLEALAQRIR